MQGVSRPRYDHKEHNPQIIKHLDLDRVARRCASFKRLRDFVLGKE